MPRIQIMDVTGRSHDIDSSDQETISKWLYEMLIRTAHPRGDTWPTQIRIYPLPNQDGTPDWPPAPIFMAELGGATPNANVRGLIKALSQYADMVETTPEAGT